MMVGMIQNYIPYFFFFFLFWVFSPKKHLITFLSLLVALAIGMAKLGMPVTKKTRPDIRDWNTGIIYRPPSKHQRVWNGALHPLVDVDRF